MLVHHRPDRLSPAVLFVDGVDAGLSRLKGLTPTLSKIHSLVNPFHSQPALFARVCLPGRRTCSQATLRRGNHAKSVGIDLNRLPLLDLSPTHHHARHRCSTLQNA